MCVHVRADRERGKTRRWNEIIYNRDASIAVTRLINARKKPPAKLTDSKTGVASTGKPPGAFCEPYPQREREGRRYYILGHRAHLPRDFGRLRFAVLDKLVKN